MLEGGTVELGWVDGGAVELDGTELDAVELGGTELEAVEAVSVELGPLELAVAGVVEVAAPSATGFALSVGSVTGLAAPGVAATRPANGEPAPADGSLASEPVRPSAARAVRSTEACSVAA